MSSGWLAISGTPLEKKAREQGIPVLTVPAFWPWAAWRDSPSAPDVASRASGNPARSRCEGTESRLAGFARFARPARRQPRCHLSSQNPRWPVAARLEVHSHRRPRCDLLRLHQRSLIASGVPAAKIEVIYAAIEWPALASLSQQPFRCA